MNLRKKFKEADLLRIKNAVKEAESKISGEIVPVIVERSGIYALANYRAALTASGLAFLSIVVFDRYMPAFAVYDPLLIFLIVLATGFLGAILTNGVDFIKRAMLTQQNMDRSTRLKAESSFLQEEVFNTRQRTGIMIFISFFEHEVIIMADKGISKVVDQKVWDKIVTELIGSIKKNQIVEGLEQAIKSCGDILLQKEFLITPDDVNELKDDLRIE
jgi:putative membrane protein